MRRKPHATSNLQVCYKPIIAAFMTQFNRQSEAFYCNLQLSVSINTSLIVLATQMMQCGNLESELLSHNLLETKRSLKYEHIRLIQYSGGGWGGWAYLGDY